MSEHDALAAIAKARAYHATRPEVAVRLLEKSLRIYKTSEVNVLTCHDVLLFVCLLVVVVV